MDVKQEIEALRAEIMEHNRHYYDEDAPVISDFEYDALMRRLEELEAAHPEFYSPTSPTQKVGGTAKSTFAPVTHEVPLESLNDVFSFDELREFALRQCDALFEIFKGKPYDLLHERVHGGNLSVADARASVAVNEYQLGFLQ